MSAGIDLPKNLYVHGWVLTKGEKMSKSTGNVVEPFAQIKEYGKDPFRFYLLSCMPLGRDGDYNKDLFKDKINSELVSNFSNFCYRTLSFLEKKYNSKITKLDNDKELIEKIKTKEDLIKQAYEDFKFKKVVEEIMNISQLGNQYFQSNEPWKEKEDAINILTTCVNIIKDLTILLKPIIPSTCKQLEEQLNLKDLNWNNLGFNLEDHTLNKAEILFKKIK
jgi:methionyl-tRNA synthetase